MAIVPADGGNPNFFTTYKGRFALELGVGATSTNKTLMLSIVNDVQFTGSVEVTGYVAGSAFATLPAACRPDTPAKMSAVVTVASAAVADPPTDVVTAVTVGSDGSMSLPFDYPAATVHLAGLNFNITGNFYKEVVQ